MAPLYLGFILIKQVGIMIINCCAISAPGLVRTENQDNLYINGVFRKNIADNSPFRHRGKALNRGLYAVADGMGGEKHGELAALVAVQAMNTIKPSYSGQALVDYLMERNAVICDLINQNNGARIGSTFAGLAINNRNADVVNIGDSRVYLLRGRDFTQLSRDHTPVQQMIDLGVIAKEAARSHPNRHKLTQHLGVFPEETVIEPYVTHISITENDLFLLCSDGLTDMLDDTAIGSILSSSASLKEKTENLYESALKNGGKDNITILLVQVKKGGLFG